MPARVQPAFFTATRDFVHDGLAVSRGDVFAANSVSIDNANALIAGRWLVPDTDMYHRKTDSHGFGADPRRIPTPTYYSPVEVVAAS